MRLTIFVFVLFFSNFLLSNSISERVQNLSKISNSLKNYSYEIVKNKKFGKKPNVKQKNSLPLNIAKKQMPFFSRKADDYVLTVGGTNPDEIKEFTGNQEIIGDILVLNNGQLTFENCNFKLKGNIVILNNGKLTINGGSFTVLSEFRYQHAFSVYDDGIFSISDCNVSFNGFNQEAGITGNGQFLLTNTTFSNGLTTALMGSSKAVLNNSNPLEWVIFDSGDLTVNDSDGQFIFWFEFKNGATGDLTFPDGDNVTSFQLSTTSGNATGIDYSVSLNNVKNVWWGLMLHTGSDVTVRDSYMRTTGIIPDSGTNMNLTGLVNGQTYEDSTMPIDGITYRLVNTKVDTWNIYPWGVENLNIDNCIIGEIGAINLTKTTVNRTLIDGTGGYVFSGDSTQTTFLLSALQSDAIANDNSYQIYVYSNLSNGDIVASDNGTILLINCSLDRSPIAEKSGIILELNINPLENPEVNKIIPIYGTAKLFSSDLINLSTKYKLYYGEGENPSTWTKIGEEKTKDLRNKLLGVWDTSNLSSGNYTLKIEYIIENGEPIITTRNVYLGESTNNFENKLLTHIANDFQWKTTLVFDNNSDKPETVTGILYENSKEVDTFSINLEGNQNEVLVLESGQWGKINCSDNVSVRVAYENRVEFGIAEFLLDSQASKSLNFLIPAYDSENLTWEGLAILNPTESNTNISLSAYNSSGILLKNIEVSLNKMSKTADILSNLFTNVDFKEIALIKATSDQSISGITISGNGNKQLLFGKAVELGFSEDLLIPHIAEQWEQWNNFIILTNIGNFTENSTIKLYSNGIEAVAIENIQIQPLETKVISLNNYLENNVSCGKIQISSENLIAKQSFINTSQLGTAEFILTNKSYLNSIALLPEYGKYQLSWMGLAVFNSSDNSSKITFTLIYDGNEITSKTVEVEKLSKTADTLANLFPSITFGEAHKVKITSDQAVSVIAISGMDQERLLFVPGVQVN